MQVSVLGLGHLGLVVNGLLIAFIFDVVERETADLVEHDGRHHTLILLAIEIMIKVLGTAESAMTTDHRQVAENYGRVLHFAEDIGRSGDDTTDIVEQLEYDVLGRFQISSFLCR